MIGAFIRINLMPCEASELVAALAGQPADPQTVTILRQRVEAAIKRHALPEQPPLAPGEASEFVERSRPSRTSSRRHPDAIGPREAL